MSEDGWNDGWHEKGIELGGQDKDRVAEQERKDAEKARRKEKYENKKREERKHTEDRGRRDPKTSRSEDHPHKVRERSRSPRRDDSRSPTRKKSSKSRSPHRKKSSKSRSPHRKKSSKSRSPHRKKSHEEKDKIHTEDEETKENPTTFIKNPTTGDYHPYEAKKDAEKGGTREDDHGHRNHRKREKIQLIMRVSCVMCIVLGMIIHVTMNILAYYDYETTSAISPWVPPSYPDVMYCPSNYLDHAKIAGLGLTLDDAFFIDAYTIFGAVNYVMMQQGSTEFALYAANPTYVMQQIMNSSARMEALTPTLTSGFTFEELTNMMSKDSSELIVPKLELVNNVIPITPIQRWTMYGTSYTVPFSLHTMNVFQATYMRAVLTLYNQTDYDTYLLYVGSDAHSIIPSFGIRLYAFQSYTVGLVVTNIKRVSTKFKPCKKWAEAERSLCVAECTNEKLCPGTDTCKIAVANSKLEPTRHCNMFYNLALGNQELCIERKLNVSDELVEDCYVTSCPVPCNEQRYQISVAMRDTIDDVFVSIAYNDPKQQQEIRQSLAIPLNTLLSNLGGSISLWSGFSILLLINAGINEAVRRYG